MPTDYGCYRTPFNHQERRIAEARIELTIQRLMRPFSLPRLVPAIPLLRFELRKDAGFEPTAYTVLL